jgi:hypothetical protein
MLSQYYPFARVGFKPGESLEQSEGSLTWSGVRVGSHLQPVVTDDRVWTTPREVSAPILEVQAPDPKPAEAEHFLFYRGVGHFDSPVQAVSQADGPDGQISIDVSGSPMLALMLPLALIWFPEQLGSFTGYVGRGGSIDTETPGWLVAGFGWLLLLGLTALVLFG